jgi:L-malate glycosyltransferase
MSKRILFFTGGSYVAGAEIITLLLLKGLKDKGHDVRCVINGWNDGDFKKRLSEIDIPYYEVKLGWLYLKKPAWTLDTLVNYPKAYITCRKVIKDFKPDVMNFTSYAIPVMLYPLINTKAFFTLHDTQLPNLKHRLIYKLLNKKIDTFIAVSNHIADNLKNVGIPQNKIRVIHNGVLKPGLSKNKIVKPDSPLYFSIIGQVAEWKGHEILISAVELLIKKGIKNFKIVITGNNKNEYSNWLLEKIEEKKIASFFIWKGFIKNTEDIFKDIDVVLIPSMSTKSKYFVEAFSLSTAEAMIRGLGAVASDRGGVRELIDQGETGLLFKEGNAFELSECMYMLIKDRCYLEFLGTNAKKKAMLNFTDQVMIQKYIDTYNK